MEERNNLNTTKINQTISNYEKWFSFFLMIPTLLTLILATGFFTWGLIEPFIFSIEIDSVKYYGIFLQKIFFVDTAIWWLLGTIVCIVTYCITKLLLSYKVLHIYYLKSIQENFKK